MCIIMYDSSSPLSPSGVPGNLLAAIYFIRPSLRKGLSTSLYIAVALADLSICIFQIPVLVSLLSQRNLVLFSFSVICTAWRLIFKSLQRFAVFLVLLLSVSRTIGLMWPLKSVSRRAVLGSMWGCLVYIGVESATLGSQEGYSYDRTGVYCFENGYQPTSTAYTSLYAASLGLPAILIFFSFVTSVVAMKRSMSDSNGLPKSAARDATKKQATVTIIIFTLTYIICNLPHFINMVSWIITMSLPGCTKHNSCYPGPLYSNPFMYWFSWNISEVLSVLINCACNPVIYYFRIGKFKTWVLHLFVPKTVVGYSIGTARMADNPTCRWGRRRRPFRRYHEDVEEKTTEIQLC